MTRKTLTVPDISCEHCEHTILEALTPLHGIESVKVDIPGHLVDVEFDDRLVDLDRISRVLAENDYPVATGA